MPTEPSCLEAFVRALAAADMPGPEVTMHDGDFVLDWIHIDEMFNTRSLSLSINGDHCAWAWLRGGETKRGSFIWSGTIPPEILECLRRLR